MFHESCPSTTYLYGKKEETLQKKNQTTVRGILQKLEIALKLLKESPHPSPIGSFLTSRGRVGSKVAYRLRRAYLGIQPPVGGGEGPPVGFPVGGVVGVVVEDGGGLVPPPPPGLGMHLEMSRPPPMVLQMPTKVEPANVWSFSAGQFFWTHAVTAAPFLQSATWALQEQEISKGAQVPTGV